MNDEIANVRMEGEILLDGQNIISPHIDAVALRRNVGMVFQQPNPFPKSIFDNVATDCGSTVLLLMQPTGRSVEQALKQPHLGRGQGPLDKNALSLSGGNSSASVSPGTGGSPRSSSHGRAASAWIDLHRQIEELIYQLKRDYTIVIVTTTCNRRPG